jgi:hypothetical protein
MVGVDIAWTDDAIRVTAVSLDDDALAGVEHHLPALEQVYRTLCQREALTPEALSEETGLAVGTVKNKLSILRRQGRAEPVGDGRWRGIAPATLVVRGDSHRGVITVTGYMASDSDYDPGNPENPHQNCKNGGHDPAGVTGETELSHQDAKIGGQTPVREAGETELSHQDAKIGGHGCVVCGKPVAHWGGKPARFCSDSCRKKFTRQQGATGRVTVETAESGPPDPSVCLDCHQPITAEGFQYICPPCMKLRYDKLQRQYPQKLVDWLRTQHGR